MASFQDPFPAFDDRAGLPADAAGLEGLPFALARLDRAGLVVALHGAWEGLTGHPIRSSLGTPWQDVLDPAEMEGWRAMERALRAGHRTMGEGTLRMRRPDGSTRELEVRCALRRTQGDDDGGVGVLLFALAGQAGMRLTDATTRSLVDRAAFGVFRCTPDGRLVDANPALATMLGFADPASLIGLDLFQLLHPDDGERARCVDGLRRGAREVSCDLSGRRPDGAMVQVRLAVTAEFDGAELCFLQGMAENITERARRDEIVRRGERMAALARTLAGVAHEINNPLAAITGFAQILLKRDQPEDDRHAHETILHEARRAARIVKDLLTIARREEGSVRVRVDLNAIVRYLVETQRYAMDTRGIVLTMQLADDLPRVMADPAQLEQVVLNLVVNARQALESRIDRRSADGEWRPSLEISTQRVQGNVVLSVADNGSGIPARDLPHIWDPFWTTREEGEGAGLGLSIVHSIVVSHGGTIEATSAVGVETRVTVTLPGAAPTAPVTATPPGGARAASGGAARPLDILVVDDEAAIREMLVRCLTTRGHAVVPTADGEDALRLAEQGSFDVVLSDLRMPGMDGLTLIRRLRTLPSCADTRFILSTGDTTARPPDDDDPSASIAVVPKPYDVSTLVHVVEGG